jgi:putative ABC transport system permease protein
MALATVWVPLEAAQELFAPRRDYQMMIVQVAPGMDAEEIRQSLQARLGERYTVFFEDSYTRRNNQGLQELNGLGKAASVIALLAVTLGTYTATQLSLAERAREIGILRAVGFSRGAVGRLLLVRALLQSLLAFAAGLAAAWAYIVYRQSTAPIFVVGYPLTLVVTLRQTLIGVALTGGLAWLGAWLSTRGLSRVTVHDLLKG